ncbi:flagellar export protein FliJ [Desulfolithobacter sp.]
MKPFSMEPVLKYRQQQEDRARQRFMAAREKEESLRQDLVRQKDSLQQLFNDLDSQRIQGTTPEMLILFENRIDIVRDNVRKLEARVQEAAEKVHMERKRLIKARQERKVLERLKEHQNKAYRSYLAKKEAAMLDEIAVLFHNRKQ